MANYTVNELNQAAWLVYINGLEIPVSKVETDFGVWKIPTVSLDMVPHPSLVRIGREDRLQVTIFYLDTHWDPKNPQFCLFGEFEVIGWGYSSSSRGRFITLHCASQLQILQQLYFYYISSYNDIASALGASVGTDVTNILQTKVLYPASLFLEGLTSPSLVEDPNTHIKSIPSDNFIKRPIEFVTNIFAALLRPISKTEKDTIDAGSLELPKSACSVPGKNFFARWMKMTGFHRRWAALPFLEDYSVSGCFPIVKAAQDTNVLPALQQSIGQSIGNAGSAWDLLKTVLSYMYMEVAVLPAPPANKITKMFGKIVERNVSAETFDGIVTFFVKPQCIFALPPTCNIIFPSMIENYSFQESYITQPTRIYLSETFMSQVINVAQAGGGIGSIVADLMTTGYPPIVKTRMKALRASPESNNKNFLIFPEELFKGPVTQRLNAPPWMYLLQQQNNANVFDAAKQLNQSNENEIAADADEQSQPLGSLFDKYAEYEFYRSRYAERNGGVSLAWNPYIIPGFPAAIFDQENNGLDTMAYVTSVRHTMSAGNPPAMSTSVSFSFMRSIQEFVGVVGDTGKTSSDEAGLDIAPVEVVPDVSEAFQKLVNAEDLYNRLLYKTLPMSKSSVYNWKDMLKAVNEVGYELNLAEDASLLTPYVTLTPQDKYKSLFEGYTQAMRYIARPVCTLREYIEIKHGGRSVESLIEEGIVRGEYRSFYNEASDPDKNKGAVFWGRIYKLQQGSGYDPGMAVTNAGPPPDYEPAGDGSWSTVDASTGMPQTREDWDAILENYRKIVRSEEGQVAPQL